ncbi:MAG: AMP-binding protein [Proteobacteria bacterium]|nr:AMP-binding protein [Pseudomonadota bacterium]
MNIAELIQEKARLHPDKPSVMIASPLMKHYDYPFYTFREFEERSQRIASRLHIAGVKRGERVVLFIRPCLDFSVIVFALFKMGVIPVMIDPGMGRKNLLRAIEEVKPSGLIGVNVVHVLKRVFRKSFKSLKWSYSVEKNFMLAPELLKDLERESLEFKVETMQESDPAAILFTSGGTGTPKGVITTHGILVSQTRMLQEMFNLTPADLDLPGFPLFALFTLAMGMTSIIPDMDPTKPAACDPLKIARTLKEKRITFAAGSPAIWERVGEYCKANSITLPDLKYVVMFGAPVRGEIHDLWKEILPKGTTYTPYGATECLPVSLFSGQEVLSETWEKTKQGQGVCVGRPTGDNKIFILDDQGQELPQGSIGEIAVLGPTVTPGYFEREEATRLAKIQTPAGLIHRMGDVGYTDAQGRVWFCGRKTHVVPTPTGPLYSIQVEGLFNVHPAIKRSALISFQGDAGLVVELKNGFKFDQVKADLEKINHTLSHPMKVILSHPAFPVDVRHNIKIDRIALSEWAKGRV